MNMKNFETEFMEEKWEKEFDKLEEDLDRFRDYYNKTKKCKCLIENCSHFKKERHKIFGDKIDYLYNLRMQIGFQTYTETVNSISKD